MRPFDRLALHLGAVLAGLSGLVYGWLRYFGQVHGEFGPEPHALQALIQHAHVLAAPLLLFALGMAVRGHFTLKLRGGAPEGRRSGWLLALLIVPMVLAGYGVQVATDPAWRVVLAWIHGVASLLFLIAWMGHGIMAWIRARNPQAPADAVPMEWE